MKKNSFSSLYRVCCSFYMRVCVFVCDSLQDKINVAMDGKKLYLALCNFLIFSVSLLTLEHLYYVVIYCVDLFNHRNLSTRNESRGKVKPNGKNGIKINNPQIDYTWTEIKKIKSSLSHLKSYTSNHFNFWWKRIGNTSFNERCKLPAQRFDDINWMRKYFLNFIPFMLDCFNISCFPIMYIHAVDLTMFN